MFIIFALICLFLTTFAYGLCLFWLLRTAAVALMVSVMEKVSAVPAAPVSSVDLISPSPAGPLVRVRHRTVYYRLY